MQSFFRQRMRPLHKSNALEARVFGPDSLRRGLETFLLPARSEIAEARVAVGRDGWLL